MGSCVGSDGRHDPPDSDRHQLHRAGLYYLHDKKLEGETERFTTERVAWTYAINTVENEPEAVLGEMRQTSFDQPLLKMLSGNRTDGRPTETPVMTVALAWSPEQGTRPKTR